MLKDKQILDDKRKELELREKKFQEQLSILIKERTDVEGKLQELKVLIDRKADLDEREQEVVKKLQALAERESLVEKEKIIDRERKERLGGLEQELKRKSEKLQKMIDSA